MKKKITARPAKKSVKKSSEHFGKTSASRNGKKPFRRRPKSAKTATRKNSVFSSVSDRISDDEMPNEQRLQKILAAAGFGSRRQCEELIEQGRVEVDGHIAQLGEKVPLLNHEIKVDGQRLKKSKPIYLALYKPKGFLCTSRDQQGRQRALDLIPPPLGRVFPIGRLDMDSEGLLLLTNDGALSERLTHPKYGVPKVYKVLAAGDVQKETIDQLRQGMYIADGFAKVESVYIKGHHKNSTILEMTLAEGKNREVRRLLAKLGHKVMKLLRISVGPVKLATMQPGEWRHLSKHEVEQLYGG
jgi:23S rRNA pseudouridine2605 synthase